EPPPQDVGVIARDARNDVVVAGTHPSLAGTVTVLSARIGNRWSAFALPAQEGNLSLGLNDAGSAIAAWTAPQAAAVRVATLESGGRWRSTTIARTTNPSLSTPSVAVNEAGDAVVVWNELGTASGRARDHAEAGSVARSATMTVPRPFCAASRGVRAIQ